MFKEFKQFLFRGNLLDLAVAFIMGIAFSDVVTAFVKGIVTPLIAAVAGEQDFSRLTLEVGDGILQYGAFLNALIYFVTVAAVMFVLLKAAAQARRLRASTDVPDEDAPPPTDEAVLLAEIRDLLRTQR
jgi:large conductance mechanosensitive channel